MVTIAFLADHADAAATLAQWLRAQWPDYCAGRTLADIEAELQMGANRDRLPLRLVAFEAGELAGTIVLREQAMTILPEHRPGLGGLYVAGLHRGRGIGTVRVRAGMDAARERGYPVVYATTAVAGGLLVRLGWEWVSSVQHRDERLELYRRVLASPG